MATIKSYTNLKQSKKLAKILPLESADMCYIQDLLANCKYGDYRPYIGNPIPAYGQDKIKCWSLTALLGVLPEFKHQKIDWKNGKIEYVIDVYIDDNTYTTASGFYDNSVDACVAMIEKLHELNLL